jgi:hypothetical protein
MFRSTFQKQMCSALERLDCWLRNKPYPEPAFYTCDDVFEALFDRDDPWQTKIYWYVRRRIKWTLEWPGKKYHAIKWFMQRGKRGWADCDVWSLDYYLDGWMPDALRKLKKDKHGIPTNVFPTGPEYTRKDGNPNKAATDIARKRWDKILSDIIAGFEASARVKQGLYEKELGPYPTRRPYDVPKEEWKKLRDARFLKSQELAKRDEKIFKKGMLLFAEHYWSLWD